MNDYSDLTVLKQAVLDLEARLRRHEQLIDFLMLSAFPVSKRSKRLRKSLETLDRPRGTGKEGKGKP